MYSCSKIFGTFILQVSIAILVRRRRATGVPVDTGAVRISAFYVDCYNYVQKLKMLGLYKSLLPQLNWTMDNGYIGHDRRAGKASRYSHHLSSSSPFVSFPMKICPKELYLHDRIYESSVTKSTWFQHSFINTQRVSAYIPMFPVMWTAKLKSGDIRTLAWAHDPVPFLLGPFDTTLFRTKKHWPCTSRKGGISPGS